MAAKSHDRAMDSRTATSIASALFMSDTLDMATVARDDNGYSLGLSDSADVRGIDGFERDFGHGALLFHSCNR
jgi:hypothetical protein